MIGIVLMGPAEMAPYIKNYITILEKNNISYELIHWKRENQIEYIENNIYTYVGEFKRFASIPEKIKTYYGFRKFMLKIIKEKKYDKLIVLTTQTAILMSNFLCRKYKNKYFFDYRDASYEYISLYKRIVWKIINCSKYTVISSPGFKNYLPPKDYLIAHNFLKERVPSQPIRFNKKTSGKIIIGYIGVLREIDYHKKELEILANNPRFEIHIYGGGDGLQELKDFAKQFNNVKVFGFYQEKDKYDIINTFDMMLYTYPYSFINYPALANKFYDSIILKKPMIVNPTTYSGRVVITNKIGIGFNDKDKDISEKIYNYYNSINPIEYEMACNEILDYVLKDDMKYKQMIEKFVKE